MVLLLHSAAIRDTYVCYASCKRNNKGINLQGACCTLMMPICFLSQMLLMSLSSLLPEAFLYNLSAAAHLEKETYQYNRIEVSPLPSHYVFHFKKMFVLS